MDRYNVYITFNGQAHIHRYVIHCQLPFNKVDSSTIRLFGSGKLRLKDVLEFQQFTTLHEAFDFAASHKAVSFIQKIKLTLWGLFA